MRDFKLSDTINLRDEAALDDGIAANARDHGAPPYAKKNLSIIQKDEKGRVVAGLTGYTVWNWLYIDNLWVDTPLRQQGLGARLVRAAEDEAVQRGCHDAYLWTESYEGLGFYPKLGYRVFVVKPDFPDGFTRTGFMKRIAT